MDRVNNQTIDTLKINTAELVLINKLKEEYERKRNKIINEIYTTILKSLKNT